MSTVFCNCTILCDCRDSSLSYLLKEFVNRTKQTHLINTTISISRSNSNYASCDLACTSTSDAISRDIINSSTFDSCACIHFPAASKSTTSDSRTNTTTHSVITSLIRTVARRVFVQSCIDFDHSIYSKLLRLEAGHRTDFVHFTGPKLHRADTGDCAF